MKVGSSDSNSMLSQSNQPPSTCPAGWRPICHHPPSHPTSSSPALIPSRPATLQDMLDSAKRLLLLVRGDGRVLSFKADPPVLSHVFGQDAANLTKKARCTRLAFLLAPPPLLVCYQLALHSAPAAVVQSLPQRSQAAEVCPRLPSLQHLSELLPDLLKPADFQGHWSAEAELIQKLAVHCSAAAGGLGVWCPGCCGMAATQRQQRPCKTAAESFPILPHHACAVPPVDMPPCSRQQQGGLPRGCAARQQRDEPEAAHVPGLQRHRGLQASRSQPRARPEEPGAADALLCWRLRQAVGDRTLLPPPIPTSFFLRSLAFTCVPLQAGDDPCG